MSNLSDIGFPVKDELDVNQVIMDIIPHVKSIPCAPFGQYHLFQDESGAQIFLQSNNEQELVGFNPAFDGESIRRVTIVDAIERDTSELDGAYKCEAIEEGENTTYPFVFDVPNFRTNEAGGTPKTCDVSLTAFASKDLRFYRDKDEYGEKGKMGSEMSEMAFIPTGLFTIDGRGQRVELSPPQAHAVITARVSDWQRRRNTLTGQEFYYFVAETFGGFIDIVADPVFLKEEPVIGGFLKGSFWLSGKIVGD